MAALCRSVTSRSVGRLRARSRLECGSVRPFRPTRRPPSEWRDPALSTIGDGRRGADDASTVRIQVNDRCRIQELQAALIEASCDFVTVDEARLDVTHPGALDEREERIELAFFLRGLAGCGPGSSFLSSYAIS